MKLFYDHLIIDLDEVYAEIELLEIKRSEKAELISLIDETTHHQVMDTILKHLDKKYHHKFLDSFHASPYDPIHLSFLKGKVADIEDKIKATAKKLKNKLLDEIRS